MTEHAKQDQVSHDLNSNSAWERWLSLLSSRACYWAFSFQVQVWKGQEHCIADDATQETVLRILERSRRAACGEAEPIEQPERMLLVTQINYLRDQRRHDLRVVRISSDEHSFEEEIASYQQYVVDPAEMALDNVFHESLFFWAAHQIAAFPRKVREALLRDLAQRMYFDEGNPTPLQQAFLQEGIHLQDFREPLPTDVKTRTRHAALLHLAYKRLRRLAQTLDLERNPEA